MTAANSAMVDQLVIPSVLVFFLLGCLAGAAIGVGLLARSGATLHLLRSMNQWISTRRPMKSAESVRDFDATVKGHRVVFGVLFALASAYSLYVLLSQIDADRLAVALAGRGPKTVIAAILIESVRWLLVAGSALALAVGVMLAAFPGGMRALEERANRWVSSRRIVAGGDTMYLPLDRLVEDHPRQAGWMILAASVVAAAGISALLVAWR